MKEQIIGKYRILEEIGRGGMGVVYKGRHLSLHNRYAAIKTLPAQLASDEVFLKKFMDEAEILAKLHHQNIVNIYDIEIQDETYFLIMEFVNGRTLAQLLKSHGPFPPDEAARIIRDTARALSHSHAKGIIHRDIKPANIMIDENGVVKVTDFGIARATESAVTHSVIIGTPKYMPPERIKAEKDIDGRSDIYSLGIVFYEIVTGRVPFNDNSEFAVLEKQVKEPPPPPSSLVYDFPLSYEKIILKCLEKDKQNRYPDCEELVSSLEKAISRRKSALSGPETGTVTGIAADTGPRFRRVFVPAAAVLLLVAAVIVYMLVSGRGKPEPGGHKPLAGPESTAVRAVITPARPHVQESALKLRLFHERNDELLSVIKNRKGPVTEADIHRLLVLKTGIKAGSPENSELLPALSAFLDSMEIVTSVKQGDCDILLAVSGRDTDLKVTVESNVYGNDPAKSHVEVLSAVNRNVLFSDLDAVIKRNFCFSALHALSLINPTCNEIGVKVKTSGKTDRIFQIGDSINICLTPVRNGYPLLFDINLDGIYLLFPQAGEGENLLKSGRTKCSGDIEVSPPTGNEMILAMVFSGKDLVRIRDYFSGTPQGFYRWSYEPADRNSAISLCERLVERLSNEPFDRWCTKSIFIKTIK